MKNLKLKTLAIITAILALANPIIGFASFNFDIANAYVNPDIYINTVSQPLWIFVGMPLFFLTDILGWYILTPILLTEIADAKNLRHKRIIKILAIIYGIVGSIGVLVNFIAYYAFIGGYISGIDSVNYGKISYDLIWGTINNFFGGILFILIGINLFKIRKFASSLSIINGAVMLSSSILLLTARIFSAPSVGEIASTITTPIYLLSFPITVLILGWNKE